MNRKQNASISFVKARKNQTSKKPNNYVDMVAIVTHKKSLKIKNYGSPLCTLSVKPSNQKAKVGKHEFFSILIYIRWL